MYAIRSYYENVVVVAGPTQDPADFGHIAEHLMPVVAMHHGEQVVGPLGQMAGPAIAVADKIQMTDALPQGIHHFIVHIPHRHAIGLVAQGVVVGHDSYNFV